MFNSNKKNGKKRKDNKIEIIPPHLQIDKPEEIKKLSQIKYQLSATDNSGNYRSSYGMLTSTLGYCELNSFAKELNYSVSINEVYYRAFLQQFNKYIQLNYYERSNYLASLLFSKETVERNLDQYTDDIKLNFLYEMTLTNIEAKETAQALKHVNMLLHICRIKLKQVQKLDINDNQKDVESGLEVKEAQALLLLLELQRSCKNTANVAELIDKGITYINKHPHKLKEKSNLFLSTALIKLNDFETGRRKFSDLQILINIYYYIKEAFVCNQKYELASEAIFYRDRSYADTIRIANTIPLLIIYLLDYDYVEIALATRLIACKTALVVFDFMETVNEYIACNSEIQPLLQEIPSKKLIFIKQYIERKIAMLENTTEKCSIDDINTISSSVIEVNVSESSISVKTSEIAQVDVTEKLSIKSFQTSIAKLDQAEFYLLKRKLELAEGLYKSLLKVHHTFEVLLKVRLFLGLADLNNLIASKYSKILNLDKRYQQANALTEEDIETIDLANKHYNCGINYCKRANQFSKQFNDSELSLTGDMTLASLQLNMALYQRKLERYEQKMNLLKTRLIAEGKWGSIPQAEKSLTATMFRKMLYRKQTVDRLNSRLQKYKCLKDLPSDSADNNANVNLANISVSIERNPINFPDEFFLSNATTTIGYLYPLTLQIALFGNAHISVIGYVYPVVAYHFSMSKGFSYQSTEGHFFALTHSYFPPYLWQNTGTTYYLPIDHKLDPEKDATQYEPGFTTHLSLFFTPNNLKLRRHSFTALDYTMTPSERTLSDRSAPEVNYDKRITLF